MDAMPPAHSGSDNTFFQFEADFVNSLRCIPMQVRLKLDTCGVKLKLEHWHRFSEGDRQRLTQLPCHDGPTASAYTTAVQTLVQQVQGTPASTLAVDPAPPWHNGAAMPAEVQAQAALLGVAIALEQWRSLSPLQRFALIKLSRPGHENRNFAATLTEFGLASRPTTPQQRH
ncbi:nitrate reductase associated protein [Nodosilinea sp. E11]|uniref:nitrate reductase associated protein n=1 Tax=Nodosilinea sp. E11 TaxID=3037479 RepID=UPI00293500BE|nr:nitrate reductase associated protein [Nodosilinea sp. E11]WOD40773.1 nitrate reductase associated protein [Nodosilinea sp. E11]